MNVKSPDRRTQDETVENDLRKSERREDNRIEIELWMEEVSGDDLYFRRAGNLSAGGVYFDAAIPHTAGTVITLKFSLPDTPGEDHMIHAKAEVISNGHEAKGVGMGLKFLSVEGDGKKRIADYLESVIEE